MLQRIHHAAIICSDYQESKKFYVETLGLKVLAENYRAERKSYQAGSQFARWRADRAVLVPDAPVRPSYPEARGLRHLAFVVDDVVQAKAVLRNRALRFRRFDWTNSRIEDSYSSVIRMDCRWSCMRQTDRQNSACQRPSRCNVPGRCDFGFNTITQCSRGSLFRSASHHQ